MTTSADQNWLALASVFPASVDTETDPSRLKDGFTPEGWGYSIDSIGKLSKGTQPTGAANIVTTAVVGASTYSWYYRRLWLASSRELRYCAKEYVDEAVEQDIFKLSFEEDEQNLVAFIPFNGVDMYVGKSTGGYRVFNAISSEGNFEHGNIVPSAACTAADRMVVQDENVYLSNANGVMAWNGGQVEELTKKVRSIKSVFANKTLTVDRQRKWIVGDGFVIDPGSGSIFRFDKAGFRFTTRQLVDKNFKPFVVDTWSLTYTNSDKNAGQITYQIKYDEDWMPVQTEQLQYSEGNKTRRQIIIPQPYMTRHFQIRILSITGNIAIQEIGVLVDSSTFEETPTA